MDYFEFVFKVDSNEDYQKDLLLQAVAEAGFDSFEDTEEGFKAYIPKHLFNQDLLDESLAIYKEVFLFSYSNMPVAGKNWNEIWESNFQPISIGETCYIRATFHESRPEVPFEIVIDPKMSFGTGHHQTTTMMLQFILANPPKGKIVLDMGCGTAILGILASKMGAQEVCAIDYDPVCYDSAIENANLNNCSLMVLCGSKEVIPTRQYDVIYANINRNILLDQFERYAEVLKKDATLYLSGFYQEDIPVLMEKANSLGLTYIDEQSIDNWAALKLIKN